MGNITKINNMNRDIIEKIKKLRYSVAVLESRGYHSMTELDYQLKSLWKSNPDEYKQADKELYEELGFNH